MSYEQDTFTINLPNKDSFLGTFICNDKEEVDIYFDDIKHGYNFTAKKKNKPKNGNSSNYFQDFTVISRDKSWEDTPPIISRCDIISSDIIFGMMIKYYNEQIWQQVRSKDADISKQDGFGAFCTYFCDLQINNWNVDMWKDHAQTLIKKGKIV